MAHARKDTLAAPKEYAKHLRPHGKRIQAKAERQAAKKQIHKETGETPSNPSNPSNPK